MTNTEIIILLGSIILFILLVIYFSIKVYELAGKESKEYRINKKKDLIMTENTEKKILQEFIGTIYGINPAEKYVAVQLEDITNPENPNELAEISFDEFPDAGAIVQFGQVFSLKIYEDGHLIQLLNTGKWSESEIEIAQKIAQDYYNFFKEKYDKI